MNQTVFYIYAIIAIIVGAYILKRVIGCLMRSIVLVVLIAALVAGYFLIHQQ